MVQNSQAVAAWEAARRLARRLVELERIDPAFAQRVQHYRQQQERLRQQQQDWLSLEKQRAERAQKPEQDRGISR